MCAVQTQLIAIRQEIAAHCAKEQEEQARLERLTAELKVFFQAQVRPQSALKHLIAVAFFFKSTGPRSQCVLAAISNCCGQGSLHSPAVA